MRDENHGVYEFLIEFGSETKKNEENESLKTGVQ